MKILSWISASRLPSQSYIFFPILLGQSLFYSISDQMDWALLAIAHFFGFALTLYIIFANDYADQETDSLNQTFTIFSGGSRALVNHTLRPKEVFYAAWLMAVVCLILGIVLTSFWERYYSIGFVVFSLLLLWTYSYPPIQLSYRGGGEFLQAIGVGIVLPVFGFYIQSNQILEFPIEVLILLFPTNLAIAITTSLPDQISDSLSKKRTLTVILGDSYAKICILILQFISICLVYYWYESSGYIYLIPSGILLLSLAWIRSKPGELTLSLFIFLQILVTLSVEFCLIIFYFT